jgi:hypothetical protein
VGTGFFDQQAQDSGSREIGSCQHQMAHSVTLLYDVACIQSPLLFQALAGFDDAGIF